VVTTLGVETPIIQVMPFTESARAMWNEYRVRIDKKMRALDDDKEAYASIYNRAGEHAAKIALIISAYELLDSINDEAIGWAIRYVDNALNGLTDALEREMSESDYERYSKRMIQVVEKLGRSATYASIVSRSRWLDRRTRQQILDDMVDQGMLALDTEWAGNGREKKIYRLP